MARLSPGLFVRQVRQEVSKITWPTFRQTLQGLMMVSIIVFFAALFFLLMDQISQIIVRFLLGIL